MNNLRTAIILTIDRYNHQKNLTAANLGIEIYGPIKPEEITTSLLSAYVEITEKFLADHKIFCENINTCTIYQLHKRAWEAVSGIQKTSQAESMAKFMGEKKNE